MDVDTFINSSLGKLEVVSQVDRRRWSKYFLGKSNPTLKTIKKIASRLEMEPEELVLAIGIKAKIYQSKNRRKNNVCNF